MENELKPKRKKDTKIKFLNNRIIFLVETISRLETKNRPKKSYFSRFYNFAQDFETFNSLYLELKPSN